VTAAADEYMTKNHEARLITLAAARAEEKKARALRREGKSAEAIEAYDYARELYADTSFAFDSRAEDVLVDEVKRAISRCDAITSNLKHPKPQRSAAITPRPDCLDCGKPLRRFKWEDRAFADGTPREWGDYGDNRFCGLRCGWGWACAHAPMPKKAKKS
jgi:hypothetical protein